MDTPIASTTNYSADVPFLLSTGEGEKTGYVWFKDVAGNVSDVVSGVIVVVGMTLELIPAGTFTMGSPKDEPGREGDETQHEMTLTKRFYIQTTEVTQGQWKAVMGSSPSYFSDCGDNYPV